MGIFERRSLCLIVSTGVAVSEGEAGGFLGAADRRARGTADDEAVFFLRGGIGLRSKSDFSNVNITASYFTLGSEREI